VRSAVQRYREPLAVAALIALPFIAYVSHAKQGRSLNVADRVILTLSAPLQWGLMSVVDGAQDAWFSYLDLRGVRDENLQLRREVLSLRRDTASLGEMRLENQRLRRLLDYSETAGDIKVATARVIGVGNDPKMRTVRIARGTDGGVDKGMAVVTAEGTVGRVERATAGYADVLLLADPSSALPVLTQRTRARAVVRGTGADAPLRVEWLVRTEDVEEGDLIVTSGTAGTAPRGLRVGRITNIRRKPFGLFQQADLVPAVDFSRLEEVMVVVQHGEGPPNVGQR
jgi:rod shape-determining protein MreC